MKCDICGQEVTRGFSGEAQTGNGKFRHTLFVATVCEPCHERFGWAGWDVKNVKEIRNEQHS